MAGRPSESAGRGQPESWGHLRVLECIGRGAFGEVYRAWETRLDREVALKLLRAHVDDASPPSVIEEGRLLARVRHPNVVTIHGAERIDGRIGLWMEFVKGRTLEQALREGTRFTEQEVARIGVELCGAVSAVHAAGLVHRDIKAQNVMMAEDARLVLMDFGTGLELRSASETPVAGTPLYLSPEVLAGGPATVQSDVYSIGVLLYHLLTNRFPFRRATWQASAARTHAANGTDLLNARAGTPAAPRARHRAGARSGTGAPVRQRRCARRGYRGAGAGAATPARGVRPAAAVAVIAAASACRGAERAAPAPRSPRHRRSRRARQSQPPAIAVLPFRNLSSAPDTGYFADGLTREIIRNLPAINGLQLRSQTSSACFKDRPRDVAQIGEQLRVNLIVDGDRATRRQKTAGQRPARAGCRRRASSGRSALIRTLEEVFAIQDEISRAVVNEASLDARERAAPYRHERGGLRAVSAGPRAEVGTAAAPRARKRPRGCSSR